MEGAWHWSQGADSSRKRGCLVDLAVKPQTHRVSVDLTEAPFRDKYSSYGEGLVVVRPLP